MSRYHDQAAAVEELHRQTALENQFRRSRTTAPSAHECEECGEPIPEARRLAAVGCRCCLNCQQEIERYGKTRFATR